MELGKIKGLFGDLKDKIVPSKERKELMAPEPPPPKSEAEAEPVKAKPKLDTAKLDVGRAMGQAASKDKMLIDDWKAFLLTFNVKPHERILEIANADLREGAMTYEPVPKTAVSADPRKSEPEKMMDVSSSLQIMMNMQQMEQQHYEQVKKIHEDRITELEAYEQAIKARIAAVMPQKGAK